MVSGERSGSDGDPGPVSTISEQARPILFPERFAGLFKAGEPRFAPLLEEARAALARLDVHEDLRVPYRYLVADSVQPAYMLLPLLYLALAEELGGVTARHRAYLPWYLLAMELAALLDDATDCTPMRGGRPSYPQQFGELFTIPTTGFLLSTLLQGTWADVPELGPMTVAFFRSLCSTEMVEHRTRYPAPDQWEKRLAERYGVMHEALSHCFNSAVVLHGAPQFPREVTYPLAELIQDVDDVVNIVEDRDLDGENADFEVGIVTFPLVAAASADPQTGELVESLWATCRAVDAADRYSFAAGVGERRRRRPLEHTTIRAALLERGVPATRRKILASADSCEKESSGALRRFLHSVSSAFVNRLESARIETPR